MKNKTIIDFYDAAIERLGFGKPIQELSDEQADQVDELALTLYNEWGEDMLFAEEYEQQRRGPGLQI